MLLILFFLFMMAWSIGGGVAAMVLYDMEVLPVKDPFKRAVSAVICGPITWAAWVIIKAFEIFENWLREEESI